MGWPLNTPEKAIIEILFLPEKKLGGEIGNFVCQKLHFLPNFVRSWKSEILSYFSVRHGVGSSKVFTFTFSTPQRTHPAYFRHALETEFQFLVKKLDDVTLRRT